MVNTRKKTKKVGRKTRSKRIKEQLLEESVFEEPIINESLTNDFLKEEPVINESLTNDFLKEEPVINESLTNDFLKEEPVVDESLTNDFLKEEPVVDESLTNDFLKEEPGSSDLLNKTLMQSLPTVDHIINDLYSKLTILDEETPIKIELNKSKDWYVNLNAQLKLVPVVVYLELHGIDKDTLKKHALDHALDTLAHNDRLLLAKAVKTGDFLPQSPLEKHIVQYFGFLTIRDENREILALTKDNGMNAFYNVKDWSKCEVDESVSKDRFFVDIDELSCIFGYMKVDEFHIEHDGRRTSANKSSKTDLISKMNEVLLQTGSNLSYDVATTKDKPTRNSDNLTHTAFCGILELVLRKMNAQKTNDKLWFLRPEQHAFMES
jgi:hypothetical protein